MRTPPKGDYASLPLTAAATKAADAWDPAKDTAAGEQCRAYGAAAIMRMPGRIRITWENDTTLKIETEAGTQTRLLNFVAAGQPGASAQRGEPSWQGTSIANWQTGGRWTPRRRRTAARWVLARRSPRTCDPAICARTACPTARTRRVTEYINRTNEPNGDAWLIVTTVVEDPQNLTSRFVTSSHFKKVPDGSAWSPTPCSAS